VTKLFLKKFNTAAFASTNSNLKPLVIVERDFLLSYPNTKDCWWSGSINSPTPQEENLGTQVSILKLLTKCLHNYSAYLAFFQSLTCYQILKKFIDKKYTPSSHMI